MHYFTEQRPIVQPREAIITGFRAGIDFPKQPKPVVFRHSGFRRCPGANSDFGRFGRRTEINQINSLVAIKASVATSWLQSLARAKLRKRIHGLARPF